MKDRTLYILENGINRLETELTIAALGEVNIC